jgi:hypothetical protein
MSTPFLMLSGSLLRTGWAMSVKVMTRVWEHSRARHAELLVMLALADWSDDAGVSYPSIPKLARKARLTERQTRRALNALEEELAELHRQRSNGGRNRPNHYLITLVENPDKITLKKLQGKNYPEKNDQETLVKMSGAYIRHRTVNNGGSKKRSHPHTKDSDPRIKELTDAWAALYSARHGDSYHFTGKDFGLFKSALGTFDLSRLKELMARFFENADSWVKEKAGFTVGVFHSKLNSLASTSAASPRREREVMTV